jgi:hypothetical protein
MSRDQRWLPSHVTEITRNGCLELLAGHEVGRMALVAA